MQTYFLELAASWEATRAHPGYFPPQQHSGTMRRRRLNYLVSYSLTTLVSSILLHANTKHTTWWTLIQAGIVRLLADEFTVSQVPSSLSTLFFLGFLPVSCTVVGSLTSALALLTLCRLASPCCTYGCSNDVTNASPRVEVEVEV